MSQQAAAVLNAYEEGAVTGMVNYIEYLHPDWKAEEVRAEVMKYGKSYDNDLDWGYWLDYLLTPIEKSEGMVH